MSMASAALRIAKRRASRSLLVNPPSRKTGWENRSVVTIGTARPVSSSAWRNGLRWLSHSAAVLPNGNVVFVEGDPVGTSLG